MNFLLAPAIRLMNRFSYRRKFVLISVVALAPLLVLSGMTVVDARQNSRVVAQELAGLEALIRLRGILSEALALKGSAILMPTESKRQRGELEKRLASFDAVARYDSIAAARAELDAALSNADEATEGEEALEAHFIVVERILALWQAVASEARLEADSDPAVVTAAFWHGNLATVGMVRLAELRDRGILALQKQRLSTREKNAVTLARSDLDALLDKLSALSAPAGNAATSSPDTLRDAESRFQAGAIGFGEALVTRLVNAGELSTPPAEFAQLADAPL